MREHNTIITTNMYDTNLATETGEKTAHTYEGCKRREGIKDDTSYVDNFESNDPAPVLVTVKWVKRVVKQVGTGPSKKPNPPSVQHIQSTHPRVAKKQCTPHQ